MNPNDSAARLLRYMRFSGFGLLAAALVLSPGTTVAEDSKLWTPKPRATGCAIVDAHLLMLDVSQSMLKDGLFTSAVEQVANYIDAAPTCAYAIIGRFGTTADVVADSFLLTPQDRQQLKAALHQLRASHGTTNLDEAAKLIEWVHLKLEVAYEGDPITLSVKVLSDELSDPDPDKRQFSLRRFFEERLARARVNLLEIALTPSGRAPAVLPAPEGYAVITTPVGSLGPLLSATMRPPSKGSVPSAVTVIAQAPPIDSDVDPSALRTFVSAINAHRLFLASALLLAVASVFVLRRHRADHAGPALEEPAAGPDLPAALNVTEREYADKAVGEPRTVRQNVLLGIAPSTAVTFGNHEARCTYVVTPPVADAGDAAIVTVALTPGGVFHVKAMDGASCDGAAIGREGVTRTADRPFRLRFKNREWVLTPAHERTGRAELFQRVRAGHALE